MTDTVAVAIGPSVTSAEPFSTTPVRTVAVTLVTWMFLFRLAALNAPAVARTTSPTFTPSVSHEPAARVNVQAPAVPPIVIDAPVTLTPATKSFFNAAAMKSE